MFGNYTVNLKKETAELYAAALKELKALPKKTRNYVVSAWEAGTPDSKISDYLASMGIDFTRQKLTCAYNGAARAGLYGLTPRNRSTKCLHSEMPQAKLTSILTPSGKKIRVPVLKALRAGQTDTLRKHILEL